MKKKILIVIVALAVIAGGIGYYQWNKPHRSSENEKPAFSLTADSILLEFTSDEMAATQKYLDKTIEIRGLVAEIKKDAGGKTEVILQTSDPLETVNCVLAPEAVSEGIEPGTEIAIKGICNGYLSLSGVNLNQAVIIE